MVIKEATFVKGAVSPDGMPKDRLPEIAFVGRSNVGKSSLINMLLARKNLARTSGTPGKTQEINFYRVNNAIYFVDLPGFGYAKTSKKNRTAWQRLIGTYVTEREPLRLVCQLIDSRHEPTSLDKEVMLLLKESPAERIILLTKGDKLSANAKSKAVRSVQKVLESFHIEIPVVLTSAQKKTGRDEVLQWIQTFTTA